MEKCHFSESRNNAIHVVNPKHLKISNSTISKPTNTGILCEWLSYSHSTEKGRKIIFEGNEIYGCGKDGITIMSQEKFSAHNLKIFISKNKIQKSKGDGIIIKEMAISNLEIVNNELN